MRYFFVNADFDITLFLRDDVGFNIIDLSNINFNDDNFDEDDPETINHVRLMAWFDRYKQHNTCKKMRKELLPVAWHPTRCWDWCMSEDEKRKK